MQDMYIHNHQKWSEIVSRKFLQNSKYINHN